MFWMEGSARTASRKAWYVNGVSRVAVLMLLEGEDTSLYPEV